MSCSRTVFYSGSGFLPYLHVSPAMSPGSRAGPSSNFLPFLGRKPSQCGGWGLGWSLNKGGGLNHHPVPQSDSAACPHLSPGEPGPQWEVDKWGGSLGRPESSDHAGWMRAAGHFCAVCMAHSRNSAAPALVSGAPPPSPSQGPVQVRCGGGRVGSEDPPSQCSLCPPGLGERTLV